MFTSQRSSPGSEFLNLGLVSDLRLIDPVKIFDDTFLKKKWTGFSRWLFLQMRFIYVIESGLNTPPDETLMPKN